jgi:hypothetical protein
VKEKSGGERKRDKAVGEVVEDEEAEEMTSTGRWVYFSVQE